MKFQLLRRGHNLGLIDSQVQAPLSENLSNFEELWKQGQAILLPDACAENLNDHAQNISQAAELYRALLARQECDQVLAKPPFSTRIEQNFEGLGSTVNEGDQQEIETVFFDAVEKSDSEENCDASILAEDLWVKISWLSFYQGDDSLRFRFSFGEDFIEDVAADHTRQYYAALLTDAVFPESRLITANKPLVKTIQNILNANHLHFVERIVYFNANNGGAYLHHDRERGHAGVVYAQLTGSTYWLALPKKALLDEIEQFVEACEKHGTWPASIPAEMKNELIELTMARQELATELESFANNSVIHLINETAAFTQQLIENGYGKFLNSGDCLLLPQQGEETCCWHSVFNLGEKAGQALSFAIRAD